MAKILFIFALSMALATAYAFANGASYLLSHYNPRASMITCDKFPSICLAKGSPACGQPDCCKKQCVHVATDSLNCGMCANKCRYSEACCGGSCVNATFDNENCSRCENRCTKGSFGKYGMCRYA